MKLLEKLPRQPGRKESRYTHLLSGMPQEKPAETIIRPKAAPANDSINELQEQIDELRQEMKNLREEMATFKSQFE